MINRLVVQIKDSKRIEEELKYLAEHYSCIVSTEEDLAKEIVFLTHGNKVLFHDSWSNSYKTWNTSVCLPSFKDITQLKLLQSIGLSDKEIQEYFPWGSIE